MFVSMYVYVPLVCSAGWGQKRESDHLKLEPPCGCWEPNPDALQEQLVLWAAETPLQPHKHGASMCDEVGSFIWTRTVTFNIQVSFKVTRTTRRFGTLPGFLEFKYCLSVSAGWFLFFSTFFLEDTASLGRLIDLWLPASVNHSSQCNHVIQESWS